MKRAYVGIRAEPHYRRDAFVEGLRVIGYDVRIGAAPQTYDCDTVYVSWNRYSEQHECCNRLERAGGVCLIAENGYVGPGGVSPHQMEPREWYALAIGGHNGSGTWPSGGPERWSALGVDLKPWRTSGEHILVCANRSFGRPDTIMPVGWAQDVAKRLQRVTKRPIRVRPHPGNGAPKTPLADDLRDCWAMVVWSSSAGVQALIEGIPVICEAPRWICREAVGTQFTTIENPFLFDRLPAMQRLAWGQWTCDELASGEAFRHLLQTEEATV